MGITVHRNSVFRYDKCSKLFDHLLTLFLFISDTFYLIARLGFVSFLSSISSAVPFSAIFYYFHFVYVLIYRFLFFHSSVFFLSISFILILVKLFSIRKLCASFLTFLLVLQETPNVNSSTMPDDQFDALNAPLSNNIGCSIVNVLVVKISYYRYKEGWMSGERTVDPTFLLCDIQRGSLETPGASVSGLSL